MSATSSPDRQQYREVLATLAEKTKTKIPDLNGRVEKATRLALAGDIELHADGSSTVYSSSDPTRRYEIIDKMCSCRDWEQAPQHLCQHRLGAGLMRKALELCPPTPSLEAPAPAAAAIPASSGPLGEAPASVNVRLTIGGREVQLTLRDHDEARLLVRLEAVLARFPAAQPPTQPAITTREQVQGWCSKHDVAMQQNHKEGRSWYSHRLPEGGWCKGK
jgi:hypothetical protein